jgi:hypothetical protein
MKTIRLVFFLTAFTGLFCAVHAADGTRIQGILISASNDQGKTDPRLSAYEPTLKSILRFESYRFLGDDSTALAVPASGQLSLGDGHQLEVKTESADARGIHVRVRWTKSGRALMNTGLVLRPGVPAVLGGPSTGNKGEVYAVIVIGR